jgi:predicted DNA-binding transcriptional regulator AlpA
MTQASIYPDRFLRERQIIYGDPNASPPIAPLLPISHAYFWVLVKRGVIPQPLKLGKRCSVWKMSDIQSIIDSGEVHHAI